MDVSLFDYKLPPELIAQEPLPRRDASRLLVLERGTGRRWHRDFAALPELLSPGDLLVLNRSRVIPARLLGRRKGGGTAEVLLVRRLGEGRWEALVRPARRLPPDAVVEVAPGVRVRMEMEDSAARGPLRVVRLLLDEGIDEGTAIERHGHVPLPPYIRRADHAGDRERYQTVYAREAGSVAAPTAGLHFTHEMLARLAARGIGRAELVLHVGPGTFRPVAVRDLRDHRIEPETFEVPADTAQACAAARAGGNRLVAVGTTTARALETAVGEGDAPRPLRGETGLVIVPGHRFRAVDALLTNFHLPRSSLLALVCAFGGREPVLAAYAEAVRERYRFYSYGDAMLVL